MIAAGACLTGACASQPPAGRVAGGPAGWQTLRAEHRVGLELSLADGRVERRQLRGVIAVQRPDRFRLRALGPAGITLFDLLSVHGRMMVKEVIRGASAELAPILESIAGDLHAAYDLEPRPADRTVRLKGEMLVVRDRIRTVVSTPTAIDVQNRAHRYRVHVDVTHSERDLALDTELFRE
jgi:hypothetical protein